VADVVARARHLAADLLAPAAAAVEAAETVPRAHLDALADAGLYGLTGPAEAAGLAADPATVATVVEELAAGDLATTFVWLQHLGVVRLLSGAGSTPRREEFLRPVSHGRRIRSASTAARSSPIGRGSPSALSIPASRSTTSRHSADTGVGSSAARVDVPSRWEGWLRTSACRCALLRRWSTAAASRSSSSASARAFSRPSDRPAASGSNWASIDRPIDGEACPSTSASTLARGSSSAPAASAARVAGRFSR
jgi:hypothetical protein